MVFDQAPPEICFSPEFNFGASLPFTVTTSRALCLQPHRTHTHTHHTPLTHTHTHTHTRHTQHTHTPHTTHHTPHTTHTHTHTHTHTQTQTQTHTHTHQYAERHLGGLILQITLNSCCWKMCWCYVYGLLFLLHIIFLSTKLPSHHKATILLRRQ